MRSVFFYTIVVGLTGGILFRSFFDMKIGVLPLVLLIGIVFGIAWHIKGRSSISILLPASLFCVVFFLGALRLEISESYISPLHSRIGELGLYEGTVVREPDRREKSLHLYIEEAETKTLFLVTTDAYAKISYGDRVTVVGTLHTPELFETETGRVFDYPQFLKAKGVSEMISFGKVTVIESGQGNRILEILIRMKHAIMRGIETSITEPAAGLGEGMLLGVKRALGEDLSETFRVAGIIHIVVLSGYNIMIVADFVMRILGYFFFPRTRLILGVLSVTLFALMVGFSATVVRASIMAILVLIARSEGKTYAVMRALSLTGVAMLLHNPYLVAFDPGFQLSFLATMGLILLAPELEKCFTRIPSYIRGHLATTVGTQLFVLPILLFSMGTLSLVSVIVNILVLPVVPYAMLLTFVSGIVGVFSNTLSVFFGFVGQLPLMYIIKIAEFFAELSFAEIAVPVFPFVFVVVMYLILGAWVWRLTQKNTLATIPFKRNSGEGQSDVTNDYEGWVIEEVKDEDLKNKGNTKSPGTLRVPGDSNNPFPFR